MDTDCKRKPIDETVKVGNKFNIKTKGFTIEAVLIDKVENSTFRGDPDARNTLVRDIIYILDMLKGDCSKQLLSNILLLFQKLMNIMR